MVDKRKDCPKCGAATEVAPQGPSKTKRKQRRCTDTDCNWWVIVSGP